ncbi:unnamed protein product [Candidula unifasciata]|uniref:Uncharacterized protein n=1 Tax=Candidula unifasciata TaxID=100452 RepID=A0A8S3YKQ0_9EUPU|nr:unnamed protein product [Candidula unifasciata]
MRSQIESFLVVAGVIAGGVLVNVPLAVGWFYGNLSPYIDSYFIASLGRENHTAGSLWMTSLWLLAISPCLVLSGYMVRYIGPRWTLVSGMICFNVGIFMSYFTLKSSFVSLHVTLAVMTGLGCGLSYSMTLLYAGTWVKSRVGLATAAVSCTLGGGALFVNLAITFYINPHNLQPDIFVGDSTYFSQREIIDRVPTVFLVIGGLSSGCHLVAIFLMRHHPDFDKYKNSARKSLENGISSTNLTDKSVSKTASYASTGTSYTSAANDCENKSSCHEGDLPDGTKDLTEQELQLSPGQVLKSSAFYLISISVALLMVGYTIELSMYKQFGLVYIPDDYFVANIGVGINIVVAVSRILWGYTLDIFNVKTMFIAVTSSHTILSAFWYFTPLANRWLYLFCTLALQASFNGIMIVAPVGVLRLFGKEYYLINYGMTFSVSNVSFLTIPQVAVIVRATLGWYWLFCLVPTTSLLALILSLCLPKFPQQ